MPLRTAPGRAPWRWSAHLLALSLSAALLVAACGGATTAAGGGGGGGGDNGAYDPVIAQIQSSFGSSMLSGTVDNGTLKIILVNGAGAAMAKLFMCSNIKPFLKAANLADTKVTIVEQSGTELATQAVCK